MKPITNTGLPKLPMPWTASRHLEFPIPPPTLGYQVTNSSGGPPTDGIELALTMVGAVPVGAYKSGVLNCFIEAVDKRSEKAHRRFVERDFLDDGEDTVHFSLKEKERFKFLEEIMNGEFVRDEWFLTFTQTAEPERLLTAIRHLSKLHGNKLKPSPF